MKQKRLRPQARREAILAAAVPVAKQYGYLSMTRKQVSEVSGVSPAAITYHFKDMDALRAELMRYAIKNRVLLIVMQGLTVGDEIAKGAPEDVKAKACAALFG